VLNHVGIKVKNVARAKAFYDNALKPLGLTVQYDFTVPGSKKRFVGYGASMDKTCLWIGKSVGVPTKLSGPVHIALTAKSRKKVHAFYEAAIAAGAKDNGPPGLRKEYTPTYYAAFVVDPDGNNIEAVCNRAVA
jgi:catechol 2,3-dioxygenase-like lactoylglutathione lyase family enzyme